MKKQFFSYCMLLISCAIFSQAGHVMQGVGAVNMSMGGAATAQPLDINGALQWNPAAISVFSGREVSLSAGLFFSDPTLRSSVPEAFGGFSGETSDDRGTSLMPALAFVWGKEDSKHTFGISAFGISGFGVTFPEESNTPLNADGSPNPNFNPNNPANPINFPQAAGGFGKVESEYILLQVGFAYSYKLSDKVSIGIQPTINYATLELEPNPTSTPTAFGYPKTDVASAIGYGGQIGIFYDSGKLLKLGASYKTKQEFSDFSFKNTNIADGSAAPDNDFQMNYPAIFSVGMGLSGKKLDFALDFRYVDYDSTEGFAAKGWTATNSVKGFGWESMTIVSAGLQYKIKENFPVRIGYTYSSNPIKDELAFFSIPATAVIQDAAQIGFGYQVTDKFKVDAVYHQGFRGKGSSGQLLNPLAITDDNPLGAVPGSSISYDMETSMIQFTFSYKLN